MPPRSARRVARSLEGHAIEKETRSYRTLDQINRSTDRSSNLLVSNAIPEKQDLAVRNSVDSPTVVFSALNLDVPEGSRFISCTAGMKTAMVCVTCVSISET